MSELIPDWLLPFIPSALSPESSLAGLAIYSFLSATLLPGGSEIALAAFLTVAPGEVWPSLLLCTLGNTLGGMTSYAVGKGLPHGKDGEALARLKYRATLQRWGAPTLLLSWVPIVGDLFCVAAGWLRLSPWQCGLYMAIGKFARYALLAAATIQLMH